VTDFYNPVFLLEPDTPEDKDFTFFQTIPQLETDVTLRIQ
jgi:hypothetical protein